MNQETTMPEARYTGGCHCGAVRYEVDLDLAGAIECNCSLCSKRGLIWSFTAADKFTLTDGAQATRTYKFNKHVIDHRFCETCGVEAYALGSMPDGSRVAAINVRCLDGVDLAQLQPKKVDGASR
jgi:hypothetical protein